MGTFNTIIGPGEDLVINKSDRTYGSKPYPIMRINGVNGKVNYYTDIDIQGSLKVNGTSITGNNSQPAQNAYGISGLSDRGEFYVIGNNETWILEYLADFSNLESSIEATLIGFTKQDAGSGTYMVRIGGTSGNADGQLVAVLSTSNSSYPNGPASVKGEPFINPMGWQLVKLTAAGSLVNIKASIKNPSIEIG